MFHGVYVRNKPNKKWLLMSIVYSAETANRDLKKYLDKAKLDGNSQAEGAIQSFESPFFIPAIVANVEHSKVLYN